MTPTPKQGSAEWLAARRTGIGGSEISALYRLPDGRCAHPWMGPLKLWALKTGRIKGDQPTPVEAPHLYVGRVLEQPVREMYETFSGRSVTDGVTLERDEVAPVLIGSTDGEQTCSGARPRPAATPRAKTVLPIPSGPSSSTSSPPSRRLPRARPIS